MIEAGSDNSAARQRLDATMIDTTAVQQLYERWSRQGWHRLAGLLDRCPRQLRDLVTALCGLRVRGQHYAGLRSVPISQIRGSEGRAADFDGDFRPCTKHGR